MSTKTTPRLDALTANAKRLQSIYRGVAAAGIAGSAVLGVYTATGRAIEGPAIAFAMIFIGLVVMGGGMLVVRWRTHETIVRVLVDEPERIARIYPKQTEAAFHGASVTRYRWIVLELTDGRRLDIYASTELARVLAEVRRCAPAAVYDKAWVKAQTNISLR